jgi:hypothetical protein
MATRVGHDYWALIIKAQVVGELGVLGKIRTVKR